jgi:hypothetical protein
MGEARPGGYRITWRRLLVAAPVAFLGWGLSIVSASGITHPVEALLMTAVLTALTLAGIRLFTMRRRNS